MKNPEDLDPDRNERERPEESLKLNKPLATAYYMKEERIRQYLEVMNVKYCRNGIAQSASEDIPG